LDEEFVFSLKQFAFYPYLMMNKVEQRCGEAAPVRVKPRPQRRLSVMAFNAFVMIKGAHQGEIHGEATQANFENQIEIYSFSWDGDRPITIGPGQSGSSSGKVSIGSFNMSKKTDRASCALHSAMCTNEVLTEVNVTLLKATGTSGQQMPFMTFHFTNGNISSFHWSGGAGGGDSPDESISIAFQKFELEYLTQDTQTGVMRAAANSSYDLTRMSR
jgi:type VI secretion system secreted protein Hcp